MEALALTTGWLATCTLLGAACILAVERLRSGRRALLGSRPVRLHVVVGMATSALAFLHTIAVLPTLGSPAAIAGGLLSLFSGGAAFFLLLAHAGLGLQLRQPKLRARSERRRQHATTAVLITLAVAAHVVLLMRTSAGAGAAP